MTDRSSCQQKGPGAIVFCQPVDRRQRRTLRAPPAHSHMLRGPARFVLYSFGEAHAARGPGPVERKVRQNFRGFYAR